MAGLNMSDNPAAPKRGRYVQIIEQIFANHYRDELAKLTFSRTEIETVAAELGISLPKNIGDILYSFRYRAQLPQSIRERARPGEQWIILPRGKAQYAFVSTSFGIILPNQAMAETKIPDSTPGIIAQYAASDEQSLLARLRYNRLIDIFTGVTCYSLQNHLRTTVEGVGQIETDELYVGVDRRGAQYIFPVQAKGGSDRLSVVQIVQDFLLCESKYPDLICHPIAAQFMRTGVIALFGFERNGISAAVTSERHYRLVPPDELSRQELANYRNRPDDDRR